MIEKFKLWFQKTGLTNVGYAIAFVLSLFLKWHFLAGVFFGVFLYINYNVIQKLIRNAISKTNL